MTSRMNFCDRVLREAPSSLTAETPRATSPGVGRDPHKLRTGCQWNHISKEYGDDSTIHRRFQAWCELEVFDEIWRQLLTPVY
ncbi:transposase [Candidatus Poribacteria bacterium]|nr:transposase [Candidatus Poribacteria bacterium]